MSVHDISPDPNDHHYISSDSSVSLATHQKFSWLSNSLILDIDHIHDLKAKDGTIRIHLVLSEEQFHALEEVFAEHLKRRTIKQIETAKVNDEEA